LKLTVSQSCPLVLGLGLVLTSFSANLFADSNINLEGFVNSGSSSGFSLAQLQELIFL
jgi:hypothetical protein